MRIAIILLLLLAATGCQLIPEVGHQAVVHNPFPQLTKIAVAPFFNLSSEASVDGRQFAEAYFNELQLIPGFEVVPIGVVERAMTTYKLNLSNPDEVRKLASVLGVDAVVIGAVTDFTPYYPPRCGLQVEWYAANPCFHTIPPGYGLPWGTPEEEYIPAPLVLASEMALARAQLKTQTPDFQSPEVPLPPPELMPPTENAAPTGSEGELTSHQVPIEIDDPTVATAPGGPDLPPNWPTARAFIPAGPAPAPCACQPTNEPVLRHTRTFNGNDGEFTEALASYAFFKDEARAGRWQAYLQRSDDFIRFCCHLHIYEMLSARGGAGESRVVWRWSDDRYMYR